jgi:hypothetical protein
MPLIGDGWLPEPAARSKASNLFEEFDKPFEEF